MVNPMRWRGGPSIPTSIPDPFSEPSGPLTHDYYGWGPHKPTASGPQANGPFAYAGSERDASGRARGWSAGAGLLSGPIGGGARADVLQAQGHFGNYTDESGNNAWGINGDASLVRVGMEPGNGLGPVGFDAGVLTANAGATIGSSTTSVGAGANLIEGSLSLANKEHGIRVGGSIGVGLAGRAHYGDADGDGIRELGFGADIGPLSFDIKSEYLGRAWNAISSW